MEESRCSAPGCGALIGGRNHNSAAGTVRIGTGSQTDVPGYIEIPENDDEQNISRLVMRFILHSSLYLSCSIRKNRKILHKQLGLVNVSFDDLSTILRTKLETDFSMMKSKTQFNDDDLSMALHQVLKLISRPDCLNLDLRVATNR